MTTKKTAPKPTPPSSPAKNAVGITAETLAPIFAVAQQFGLSRLEVTLDGAWVKADFRVPLERPPSVELGRTPEGTLKAIEDETPEEREKMMFYSCG